MPPALNISGAISPRLVLHRYFDDFHAESAGAEDKVEITEGVELPEI